MANIVDMKREAWKKLEEAYKKYETIAEKFDDSTKEKLKTELGTLKTNLGNIKGNKPEDAVKKEIERLNKAVDKLFKDKQLNDAQKTAKTELNDAITETEEQAKALTSALKTHLQFNGVSGWSDSADKKSMTVENLDDAQVRIDDAHKDLVSQKLKDGFFSTVEFDHRTGAISADNPDRLADAAGVAGWERVRFSGTSSEVAAAAKQHFKNGGVYAALNNSGSASPEQQKWQKFFELRQSAYNEVKHFDKGPSLDVLHFKHVLSSNIDQPEQQAFLKMFMAGRSTTEIQDMYSELNTLIKNEKDGSKDSKTYKDIKKSLEQVAKPFKGMELESWHATKNLKVNDDEGIKLQDLNTEDEDEDEESDNQSFDL